MLDKYDFIKSKTKVREELIPQLCIWRFKKKKIVFTNGCFDILHRGHIEYLSKSANLGDIFIIGLNSDDSVKKLKGDSRPVQDEETRAVILSALHYVDSVVIFDEETPAQLIELIKPDILVKGSDYQPDEIAGADIVVENGGEVITMEIVQGFSTTNILNKLI